MDSNQLINMADLFGAHNYKPLPIVISRALGVWMWSVEGEKYLDMLSAYSAVSLGHCHPDLVSVLSDQASKLCITSRAFHSDQLGQFAKELCELTGMTMMLPMNTGAEAVETAIKSARKWAYIKKGIDLDQAEIICCRNNFHGRTTTIVSFSSDDLCRKYFGPFTPGFVLVDYGDAEAIAKAITPQTCAVLVEPIQGEAGVLIPPNGYLKELRRICDENNVLLMLDEIQTGLGRCGKLFAYEHEDIVPDVLILGKALGGGIYPVSAVLASEDILGLFTPGEHGSTFGGNPLACACAREAIKIIVREKLPQRAQELGERLQNGLRKINNPQIKEVRGKGLLTAVEFHTGKTNARQYCHRLMKNGILAKETHETTVRFAPPLVITEDEIDWALDRITQAFQADPNDSVG